MSRPSTSETTTRRGVMDTLRDSKVAKSAAALGLSATLLAGCGKSGPEGWPENPCVVETAAVPISNKDGSNPQWVCTEGARTDGKVNPGNEDVNARMGGTPTPIDIPTTAQTPAAGETTRTLTPEEQLEKNLAEESAVKHAYEYIVGGETMTFDQLVQRWTIPSNVTDPKILTPLLEKYLNELSTAGRGKDEYITNRDAFNKAVSEDKVAEAIPPVEYIKFYGDAFAEALVHPEIEANTDYIGRNINPAYLKPLYREYGFTLNNKHPFTLKHNLTLMQGDYYPANESEYRTTPEMGLRVKYDLTRSGALDETSVKNGTESTQQMIYLRVLDGRWVVLYTDEIEKQYQ